VVTPSLSPVGDICGGRRSCTGRTFRKRALKIMDFEQALDASRKADDAKVAVFPEEPPAKQDEAGQGGRRRPAGEVFNLPLFAYTDAAAGADRADRPSVTANAPPDSRDCLRILFGASGGGGGSTMRVKSPGSVAGQGHPGNPGQGDGRCPRGPLPLLGGCDTAADAPRGHGRASGREPGRTRAGGPRRLTVGCLGL